MTSKIWAALGVVGVAVAGFSHLGAGPVRTDPSPITPDSVIRDNASTLNEVRGLIRDPIPTPFLTPDQTLDDWCAKERAALSQRGMELTRCDPPYTSTSSPSISARFKDDTPVRPAAWTTREVDGWER